jgi:hypothetical protein
VRTVNQFGRRLRTVTRAQSEAVGTVLLLGMVVIGVSVVGYVVLGTIEPDERPTIDVESTVTDGGLALTHRSGDSLPGDDLAVVVRYAGSEERYDFAADGSYGADDTFDPGDRWRLDGAVPYAVDDRVEVLLVHEPSNAVLYRGRRVAATPTPTATPAPAAAVGPARGSGIRRPT